MATFNFSELQQKADKVLFNADEAIRKWVDFIQAPYGNVNFQYYDQNGNLQNVTFPNRTKIVQDFMTNVNSALTKTFYVDSINGDDANDGSSTAPFATIKKAINSVPNNGIADIYIKEGQTHIIDSNIYMIRKRVRILSWASNLTQDPNGTASAPVATSPIIQAVDDGTKLLGGFYLDNSVLYLGGWDRSVILEIGSSNVDVAGGFIGSEVPFGGFASLGTFGIAHSTVSKAYAYLSSTRFNQLRATTFTVNTSSGLLFTVGYGTTIFNVSQSTFLDGTGNALSIGSLISGVVKDANGVPRNVLINEVI